MATDADLKKIISALNAVRINAQAIAGAERAMVDGRLAMAKAAGITTEAVASAARAVKYSVDNVDRYDNAVRGDITAPVGPSWTLLRQAIQKVYVDIGGLEATVAATSGGAQVAGLLASAMGDSANWWVKYGEKLANEPNILARAGTILGDATKATVQAAGKVAAPVAEGAAGFVGNLLKGVWPVLLVAGIIVGGVVAVNAFVRGKVAAG